MLDIIYSLFQTVIHGITTLLNMVMSVPRYLTYVSGFIVNLFPSPIGVPLLIALFASVLIAIKRLVL